MRTFLMTVAIVTFIVNLAAADPTTDFPAKSAPKKKPATRGADPIEDFPSSRLPPKAAPVEKKNCRAM